MMTPPESPSGWWWVLHIPQQNRSIIIIHVCLRNPTIYRQESLPFLRYNLYVFTAETDWYKRRSTAAAAGGGNISFVCCWLERERERDKNIIKREKQFCIFLLRWTDDKSPAGIAQHGKYPWEPFMFFFSSSSFLIFIFSLSLLYINDTLAPGKKATHRCAGQYRFSFIHPTLLVRAFPSATTDQDLLRCTPVRQQSVSVQPCAQVEIILLFVPYSHG